MTPQHARILELAADGVRPRDIARQMNRAPEYVYDVLRKLRRAGLLGAPTKWAWSPERKMTA